MNDEIVVVDQPTAFERLKEKSMGKISETLDSHTMIWLLFDVSLSMSRSMQRYALADKFDWTVDTIETARKQLQNGVGFEKYDANKDDDVKQAVIDGMLAVQAPSKRSDADALSTVSRLDVAKKCTKLFVQRCFAKYPWFKVAVSSFSGITLDMQESTKTSDARLDCACEAEQKTCSTIDVLQNRGGTYIFGALHYMLETCKLAKSPAGHRVVLISDGHDNSALLLPSLVALYIKNKIVCDAVFIVPTTVQDPRNRPDGRAIIEFVKATGGVCEFVDGESSFERKFLKVAARKLLTDGGK